MKSLLFDGPLYVKIHLKYSLDWLTLDTDDIMTMDLP